jgi:halimadienyl-diphosphate synthase
LQSLYWWKRCGGRVNTEGLVKGAEWLMEHAEMPYPPLWIGKCLYSPYLVVQSTVISALMMAAA